MKHRIRCLIVILLPLISTIARAQLQPGDFVAICGDSITEQKLYSVHVQTYLLACQPKPDLWAMQFGWGGETAAGFLARMNHNVLPFKPTVVSLCYGMNDGGYASLTEERAKRYRDSMSEIVAKFKDAGVRFIVVGSPGCVDTDMFRKSPEEAAIYNRTLSQLRDIARDVATEHAVAFADVYTPMFDAMTAAKAQYGPEYHVAGADGVHPRENGHLVMAYAFLKALGCDGEIGKISVDLATGKAEASDGHRVIESANGAVEIESERYPFCFDGDPPSPEATGGIIEFFPFNSDLNLFTLVVTNPPAARMKITWGTGSKEFPADELLRGINLAAEFLDNPFCEPFRAVQEAVREQQRYETPMIKLFVHNVPVFTKMMPEEAATFERLTRVMSENRRELADAARDAVKPVRHRILIEAIP